MSWLAANGVVKAIKEQRKLGIVTAVLMVLSFLLGKVPLAGALLQIASLIALIYLIVLVVSAAMKSQ